MINKVKNIVIGIVLVLLLPLIIAIIIIVIPLAIVDDFKSKRMLKKWLRNNDYSYFFIYTTGKRKRKFIESTVLSQLNKGIEQATFDGKEFSGFIDTKIARMLSIYDNQGFPIIGKIEEGKLTHESLKVEFQEMVIRDKNEKAFVSEVQERIDKL